jgi:hypothetical protein
MYTQKYNPGHFECKKFLFTDLAERQKTAKLWKKIKHFCTERLIENFITYF